MVSKYLTQASLAAFSTAPTSGLPTLSSKFSQRIAGVHNAASVLLFPRPLVQLKIYLCLQAGSVLLSEKNSRVSGMFGILVLTFRLLGRPFRQVSEAAVPPGVASSGA